MNISYLIVTVLVAAVANLVEATRENPNFFDSKDVFEDGGFDERDNLKSLFGSNDGHGENFNSRDQENTNLPTASREFPQRSKFGKVLHAPQNVMSRFSGARNRRKFARHHRKYTRRNARFAAKVKAFNNRKKNNGISHRVRRHRLRKARRKTVQKGAENFEHMQKAAGRIRRSEGRLGTEKNDRVQMPDEFNDF